VEQVVDSMGSKIHFPLMIQVGQCWRFLFSQQPHYQKTKNIDIRQQFVRNGGLNVIFVKLEDCDADICTQNTTEELYQKHEKKPMEKVIQDNISRTVGRC
jgi:hypothetical protein